MLNHRDILGFEIELRAIAFHFRVWRLSDDGNTHGRSRSARAIARV